MLETGRIQEEKLKFFEVLTGMGSCPGLLGEKGWRTCDEVTALTLPELVQNNLFTLLPTL